MPQEQTSIITDRKGDPIHHYSPVAAKTTLFRSLFRGREDVYPRRFESRKTGRAGYQPACANEWARGLCEKPRVKCTECASRRLLPITDEVIRWHFSGEDDNGRGFVMGVYPHHIGLPRGCLEEARQLLIDLKIQPVIRDERCPGTLLDVVFHGELRPEQEAAAETMLVHDTGVLSATTAFGKTVLAAWLIAQRRVNAPVLVHRRQLLEQWIERFSAFLGLPPESIGRIGGGRRKPTGALDVAAIQSLVRKGVVDDRVAEYGYLIVDECHHLSARSFEQEVDLLWADGSVVVEVDGGQHLVDAVAYRRDRRRDLLLQENGYFVLRFLAEDLVRNLNEVLDAVLRTLAHRGKGQARSG